MAFISNAPDLYQSGIDGPMPTEWYGVDAPDGDASDFAQAAPGSRYIQMDLTNEVAREYQKQKNDARDDDWGGLLCITETVTRSQFTDGGGASGTYTLQNQIPAGAFTLRSLVQNVTEFAGDTSAALTIGDGTDVDRYNTGTPSVFTTVAQVTMGAPSGTLEHTTAKSIVLTVTSASDFTNVTTGQLTVKVYYLL